MGKEDTEKDLLKMTSTFFGNIENFVLGEDFDVYMERMDHLLLLNKITDEKLKISFFITLAR